MYGSGPTGTFTDGVYILHIEPISAQAMAANVIDPTSLFHVWFGSQLVVCAQAQQCLHIRKTKVGEALEPNVLKE